MIVPGEGVNVGGAQAPVPHHTWRMGWGDWETALRPADQGWAE